MNRLSSLTVTAGLAISLLVTGCSKEDNFVNKAAENNSGSSSRSFATATTTYDRIDAIVKDLSTSNYSLSFEKAIPEAGITRTAYGADNYLAFADPQNLKCPDPIIWRYRRIPIWRRPIIIWPTCPDMVIDIYKLRQIRDLLVKADYKQFSGLREIGLTNGGGFLATDRFTSQFPAMKLDRIDEITKGLDASRYLLLSSPGSYTTGFTRSFYGYADLNSIVFKPYGKSLKDFKPTLKGCFDPIILSTIKQKLQSMDPATYKYLTVTPLAENKNIAMLSM